MGRRRNQVYTGMYLESRRIRARHHSDMTVPDLSRAASSLLWSAHSSVNYHYLALATVCLVVLLSYMLPNISYKIHRTNELKAVKQLLDVMTKEVSRAEVACLTAADQIDYLQNSVQDSETETTSEQRDLAVCTSDSMRATQSAPVQVDKKMGFFRRIFFPYKNTSNKKTLANIGTAYDALHKDLKNLAEYSTKNALFITNFDYTKFHNNLDRRRLHDIALNTVIDAKHIQMKPPDKDDNYKLISNKNIENITPNPSPEIIYKTNIVHNHHDAAKIYKPIGFYPIDKKKHDVTVHAVLKNTDKVSANATTMTRSPLMSRRI